MKRFIEMFLRFLRRLFHPFGDRKPVTGGTERRVVDDHQYFDVIGGLLEEGREVLMTPKGDSMLPFIRNGRDSVVLSKLTRPAMVGDIILVNIGGRYVMHRVFSVGDGTVTLMGDGNLAAWETCSVDDIIGIVTEIHKEGGKVVKPGKGRLWRFLRPVRRYILAFYKRVIL